MINNNKKKILVLSPHTDDAELGAGGTIIKLLQNGWDIRWIIFSSAEESVPDGFDKDSLKNEFHSVASELNIKPNQFVIHNFKVRYLHEKRQEVLQLLYDERKQFNQPILFL